MLMRVETRDRGVIREGVLLDHPIQDYVTSASKAHRQQVAGGLSEGGEEEMHSRIDAHHTTQLFLLTVCTQRQAASFSRPAPDPACGADLREWARLEPVFLRLADAILLAKGA